MNRRPEIVAELTSDQQQQIRQAAEEAYDKLRWIFGDNGKLLAELHLLARDSFIEGMRQERNKQALQTAVP